MPFPPTLDAEQLYKTLLTLLREAKLPDNLVMVGIRRGGAILAERLHRDLHLPLPMGTLDISFYRDDINERGLSPAARASHLPVNIDQQPVLLVDDVLFTGRTIRAALQELFDCGRPRRVDLAVLIDRGCRELPITPNYCATSLFLPPEQHLHFSSNTQQQFSLQVKPS